MDIKIILPEDPALLKDLEEKRDYHSKKKNDDEIRVEDKMLDIITYQILNIILNDKEVLKEKAWESLNFYLELDRKDFDNVWEHINRICSSVKV